MCDVSGWAVKKRFALFLSVLLLGLLAGAARSQETRDILRAYLGDKTCIPMAIDINPGVGEYADVYAAPSQDAWRGANGRAQVSLREPFTLLALAEDRAWWLIEYEISKESRRIGYIRALPGWAQESEWKSLNEATVELVLRRDATMTDDPHASGRRMAELRGGERVKCFGWYRDAWAYVQTTIDGKPARGFVPLEVLALPDGESAPEVEGLLVGTWRFVGGAEIMGYGIVFDRDGTCRACDTDDLTVFPPENLILSDEILRYRVTREGGEYGIEFAGEDYVSRYGLQWTPAAQNESGRDRIHLSVGYGGGFYERYEP